MNTSYQAPMFASMSPPKVNVSKSPTNRNPAQQTSFSFRVVSALASPKIPLNISSEQFNYLYNKISDSLFTKDELSYLRQAF
jgi:hypothetical protein